MHRHSSLAVLVGLAAASACAPTGASDPAPTEDSGAPRAGADERDAAASPDPTSPGTSRQPGPSVVFSRSVQRVVLEVDYAASAEPYEGERDGIGSVWDIFADNAAALFGPTKTVWHPSGLSEMDRLDDVPSGAFRASDLEEIAERHRSMPSQGDTATFYAVFVDGVYIDERGVQRPRRLGVTVGTTGIVGLFKPAIASVEAADATNGITAAILEQSTLVHELAHAVGLVDNGIPQVTPHHDEEHPLHCTNERCLMFWSNEGARDATAFARAYVATGSRLLLGSECVLDVRTFEERLR